MFCLSSFYCHLHYRQRCKNYFTERHWTDSMFIWTLSCYYYYYYYYKYYNDKSFSTETSVFDDRPWWLTVKLCHWQLQLTRWHWHCVTLTCHLLTLPAVAAQSTRITSHHHLLHITECQHQHTVFLGTFKLLTLLFTCYCCYLVCKQSVPTAEQTYSPCHKHYATPLTQPMMKSQTDTRMNWTRKPCYRKDNRAMRPIYGCPEKFRESSQTPLATFPEICKRLLFRSILRMCTQNLKFIAFSVPEIIGGTQKIWAVPVYAYAPVSPKFLMGFCSYGPSEYICQIWSS